MNCIHLTEDKYLVLDLIQREIVLLCNRFQSIRTYKIHRDYFMNSFDLIDQKLLFSFNNLSHSKCYLFLMDFNLRILNHKRVSSADLICDPLNVFYRDKKSKKLHILDYDGFNLVQKLDTRDLKFIDYCVLMLDEKQYLIDCSDFSTSKFKIVRKLSRNVYSGDSDRDPYAVVRTLAFKDYINVVKTDEHKNLYFIRSWAKTRHDRENLFCYDSNGRFLFKRFIPMFHEANSIYFNSNKFIVV